MTFIGLPALNSYEMYDPIAQHPRSIIYIHQWVRHGLGLLINKIKLTWQNKIQTAEAFQQAFGQMSTENIRRLKQSQRLLLPKLSLQANAHLQKALKGFFVEENGLFVKVRPTDQLTVSNFLDNLNYEVLIRSFVAETNPGILAYLHNAIFRALDPSGKNEFAFQKTLDSLGVEFQIKFVRKLSDLNNLTNNETIRGIIVHVGRLTVLRDRLIDNLSHKNVDDILKAFQPALKNGNEISEEEAFANFLSRLKLQELITIVSNSKSSDEMILRIQRFIFKDFLHTKINLPEGVASCKAIVGSFENSAAKLNFLIKLVKCNGKKDLDIKKIVAFATLLDRGASYHSDRVFKIKVKALKNLLLSEGKIKEKEESIALRELNALSKLEQDDVLKFLKTHSTDALCKLITELSNEGQGNSPMALKISGLLFSS